MSWNARESSLVRAFAHEVLPTSRQRRRAIQAAQRDARHTTLDHLDTTQDPAGAFMTPFIGEVLASAEQADEQLQAQVKHDNRALIEEIYRRADAVVHHHIALEEHDTPHHRRLAKALTAWGAEVAEFQGLANAVVAHHNQLIHVYWGQLLLEYQQASRGAGRPRPVLVTVPVTVPENPIWGGPFALLPDIPPPRPPLRSSLARAIDIVWPATATAAS